MNTATQFATLAHFAMEGAGDSHVAVLAALHDIAITLNLPAQAEKANLALLAAQRETLAREAAERAQLEFREIVSVTLSWNHTPEGACK